MKELLTGKRLKIESLLLREVFLQMKEKPGKPLERKGRSWWLGPTLPCW